MFGSNLQGGIGPMLRNHLDPYRQYLQQTYIQPQSQQRLDLFMDFLQQQEQEFFGPSVSGGLTGSPAQPGGMQMAQRSALQASMPAQPQGAMAASPLGSSLGPQPQPGRSFVAPAPMDPANAFNLQLLQQNNGGPVAQAPGTGPAMSTGLSANQMSMYTPSNRHLLFSRR